MDPILENIILNMFPHCGIKLSKFVGENDRKKNFWFSIAAIDLLPAVYDTLSPAYPSQQFARARPLCKKSKNEMPIQPTGKQPV